MSNFFGDISPHIVTPTLFGTTTAVTTDANATGASVDLADNVGNIVSAVQVTGVRTGTGSPTLTTKMQESTDGSNNWTDITGGGFTAVTASSQVECIAFKPTKRYVRSTGTVAGTSPVFPVTITVIAPRRHTPTNEGGFDNTAAGN